jgi:hypothetical protein
MEEKERQNDSFFDESRAYLNAQIALLKLETVEKLTQIMYSILLILLAVILVGGAIFYLSIGFIWWSKDAFGGLLPGIFIVSGSYLTLLIIVFLSRKKMIINPLVKLFSRIFFTPTNELSDDEE